MAARGTAQNELEEATTRPTTVTKGEARRACAKSHWRKNGPGAHPAFAWRPDIFAREARRAKGDMHQPPRPSVTGTAVVRQNTPTRILWRIRRRWSQRSKDAVRVCFKAQSPKWPGQPIHVTNWWFFIGTFSRWESNVPVQSFQSWCESRSQQDGARSAHAAWQVLIPSDKLECDRCTGLETSCRILYTLPGSNTQIGDILS